MTGLLLLTVAALTMGPAASLSADSYYDEDAVILFKPYPTDTGRSGKKSWRVRYFGPVGIGIDLKRPGMTMEIANVEPGSPADKTGKLEKGQIIESINGIVLQDLDPRIILGNIITEAEASDGIIDLKIKGQGNVRVQM
jgi:predicted metalloprotease with PDZ domain